MIITKINVSDIVRDHLNTLIHEHNGKRSGPDLILFYGMPIIVATLLLWLKGVFGGAIGGVMVTAFSIFAALLFNLLLLTYDIVRKTDGITPADKLKARFLRQIHSNISYAVLISLTLIVILLAYFVVISSPRLATVRQMLAFTVYALATNFILTILMVLKRAHILLSKEIDPSQQ